MGNYIKYVANKANYVNHKKFRVYGVQLLDNKFDKQKALQETIVIIFIIIRTQAGLTSDSSYMDDLADLVCPMSHEDIQLLLLQKLMSWNIC